MAEHRLLTSIYKVVNTLSPPLKCGRGWTDIQARSERTVERLADLLDGKRLARLLKPEMRPIHKTSSAAKEALASTLVAHLELDRKRGANHMPLMDRLTENSDRFLNAVVVIIHMCSAWIYKQRTDRVAAELATVNEYFEAAKRNVLLIADGYQFEVLIPAQLIADSLENGRTDDTLLADDSLANSSCLESALLSETSDSERECNLSAISQMSSKDSNYSSENDSLTRRNYAIKRRSKVSAKRKSLKKCKSNTITTPSFSSPSSSTITTSSMPILSYTSSQSIESSDEPFSEPTKTPDKIKSELISGEASTSLSQNNIEDQMLTSTPQTESKPVPKFSIPNVFEQKFGVFPLNNQNEAINCEPTDHTLALTANANEMVSEIVIEDKALKLNFKRKYGDTYVVNTPNNGNKQNNQYSTQLFESVISRHEILIDRQQSLITMQFDRIKALEEENSSLKQQLNNIMCAQPVNNDFSFDGLL